MKFESKTPKKWLVVLSAIIPLLGSLAYYLIFGSVFEAIQIAVVLFIALSSLMYSPVICCFVLASFIGAYFIGGTTLAYITSLVVYGALYIMLIGIRKNERKRLAIIVVISIVGVLIASSYLLVRSPNEVDWRSITSFKAHEYIIIDNQTFESYINFTKPNYISRADYQNGKFLQKVIVENNRKRIFTTNETFTFNATIDDVNILDPFAAILNNLDMYNIAKKGNILLLEPHDPSQPVYEVRVNRNGLPRKIIIKQGMQEITIDYVYIEIDNGSITS